ncbi:MAG: tRNA 2-thiouridine(34) synthase MnmA [Candidatus Obscuribacterales bacterium]|nr:tRNA 2-thiouridine(34) synthase MnmA [Candidatus Obscuribacterales bacterium]
MSAVDDKDRTQELEAVVQCSLAAAKQHKPAPKTKTRVAVCMSGGVDSSATAFLLQQQGYDVVGITGWLIKSGSRCCDTGMIDAARVCEQLNVEHHAVDLRELFRTRIIDNFSESYKRARTPLPCSMCNTLIKWGALLNYADKHLDADYIATGHYARVDRSEGFARLARSKDSRKDQSYVLWGLTRAQLDKTLLPLGDFTKDQIREIAESANLVTAKRKESQDLCFIPIGTSTQQYLGQFLEERPGPIIHVETGDLLGEHQGTHNFTIGQRRGIGVAYSEPLYVTSIDPDMCIVYVGPPSALLRSDLTASEVNWLTQTAPTEPFEAKAKIRYNSPVETAMIYPLEGNRVRVEFAQPQPAITSGQVLGIYDPTDTYVLGGGWID